VADDLAGTELQCPKCGLLTDVPTLSDLGSFADEGTYRMDAGGPVAVDPSRMSDLGIIYAKSKFDEHGNEIDLRTLPAGRRADDVLDESDAVADDQGELELKPVEGEQPDTTTRPKYDPETGELIRPLEVRVDPVRDVNPASIPVAKPAINYAGGELAKRINPLTAAVELFLPVNFFVMTVVFIAHAFNAMVFIAAAGLFFLWPVLVMLQGLILSHYGNVIDDTGRNDTDDLPRPLRNLDLYDDLWSPFTQMFGGIMIAYVVPLTILLAIGQFTGIPRIFMWLTGGMFGTALAPAILLTTNTSGSTFNLRPDRVMSVIRACGPHYFIVTLLWAVTCPVYALGWLGSCLALLNAFIGIGGAEALGSLMENNFGVPRGITDNLLMNWLMVLPALAIGIYLMHYFCWYLGLLYKAHHEEFDWVLQRHDRDPMKDRGRPTHANQLGRRRPVSGHLPPLPPTEPPSAPPPAASRIG
jgi:hypothetical protein